MKFQVYLIETDHKNELKKVIKKLMKIIMRINFRFKKKQTNNSKKILHKIKCFCF